MSPKKGGTFLGHGIRVYTYIILIRELDLLLYMIRFIKSALWANESFLMFKPKFMLGLAPINLFCLVDLSRV